MLQTRGGMDARAWEGHGEHDGGRADGHVLMVADTAKRTVQVRVTGTARRWRGGRMQLHNQACGLSGLGQAARVQWTVAGAEGGHGEKVEGRADRCLLQT